MKKLRELMAVVLALGLFTGITYGAGRLLLPVRTIYGATWDQFLLEEENSLDVLFFGSSVVYCDVIPAVLWEESGLTSYVMAGPEQPLSVTWHYLRQACRTQSPLAVVVEVSGLFFDQYPELMKPNLLYMPWGGERIQATFAGADPADRLELLFPLYGDHDRVYAVTAEELEDNLFPAVDDYAGYTPLGEKEPLTARMDVPYTHGTRTYDEGLEYLRQIAGFCAQREIRLVLYLAPLYCNIPQDTLDALYRDVADIPGAAFFDCNTGEWPAFDPMGQWFDLMHLNLLGAQPFTRRLARELQDLGLEGATGSSELWQGRCAALEEKLTQVGEGRWRIPDSEEEGEQDDKTG